MNIKANTGEYVFHGKGSYTWKRMGARYEGEYKHGEKYGLGAYYYPNGMVYRGSWVAGKKHGAGTLTYQNGDKFMGEFRDDHKHGKGKYTYAESGAELVGTWVHGDVEKGKWTFPHKKTETEAAATTTTTSPTSNSSSTNHHPTTTNTITRRISVVQEVPVPLPTMNKVPFGVVIGGAPASGKGTQCEYIKEHYGLVHLSSGDMLRAAVAAGTEIGIKARGLMEIGALVPDDVVISAIVERLSQPDVQEHGFLLDGFPRTPSQALALMQVGLNVDCFVLLDVPDEQIIERVTGRRVDPETGITYHVKFNPPPSEEISQRLIHRTDDTLQAIVVRLENFHSNIDSVRSHFTDTLVVIDGKRKPKEVWADVDACLSKALEAKRNKQSL
jgi:adenylate kinase